MIGDKIYSSKKDIKPSQRINIPFELAKSYYKINDKSNTDTLFLTIIDIVAANESFFKEKIARFIDLDHKFLENSKSLIKKNGTKIDIEDISNISKALFSVGDLIAYSLKYSSVISILNNFKSITDVDLLTEIGKIDVEVFEDENTYDPNLKNKKRPFEKSRILNNLKRIYELRNVIGHDFLASKHKLDITKNEVKEFVLDTCLFMVCTEIIEDTIVFTDYKIGVERLKELEELIREKENELHEVYNTITKELHSKEQLVNLQKSIDSFKSFLNSESNNIGNWYNNEGPFFELVLEHKLKLLNYRIQNLTHEIKHSS